LGILVVFALIFVIIVAEHPPLHIDT